MSLMQLLTTGKALEGQHNSSHRYQLTNHKLLPKFGSKRNPFAEGKGRPAAPETPVIPKAPGPSVFSPGAAPQPWGARLVSWVRGLKARLRRSPEAPPRAKPVPANTGQQSAPVQGELLLEGIKVIRNDLSETDLEIVTAKPAGQDKGIGQSPIAAPTAGAHSAPDRAWDRFRSRLAGAGKN